MPSLFSQKIHTLRGIGEKRAALFEKVGAPTIGDLLMLYPRSYIDLSQPRFSFLSIVQLLILL